MVPVVSNGESGAVELPTLSTLPVDEELAKQRVRHEEKVELQSKIDLLKDAYLGTVLRSKTWLSAIGAEGATGAGGLKFDHLPPQTRRLMKIVVDKLPPHRRQQLVKIV